MSDEGFHEIQLNGKQLVFLFMAATVVSVVIFLCGVLVGRGVRAREAQAGEFAAAPIAPDPGLAAAPQSAAPPTAEPPAPPGTPVTTDELSYPERLQRDAPPEEAIAPAPVAEAAPPVARSAPVAPPEPAPAATSPAQAGASGFVVQVAALRDQRDADVIAKRLIGKGYPAYVLAPAHGAPAPVHRVQVGRFHNLREAEETAARLEKEEHFKPWIRR